MTTGLSIPKVARLTSLATKEAVKSDARKRHGAILFRGNKILAAGYNKLKTHPKCRQKYKYLHAEEDALIRAGALAKGADIYVIRLISEGIGMSRPCKTCLQVLREAGVRWVYYSTDEGKIEKL